MNDYNYFIDDLPLWSAPFGLKLLEHLKYKQNATVLDIGCGEGFPIVEIAARFGKTGQFLGLDPLKKPLKRLELKKKQYQLPTLWAVQAIAEHLPFSSNAVDRIVSNNGLNNVQNLDICLKECHRVIHPSGQMIFAVNTENTMKEFYEVFTQILETSDPEIAEKIKNQIRQKRLSKQQWDSKLEKSGFITDNIISEQFTLSFSNGTTMLEYYLIRQFFLPGWLALVEDGKRNEVFSLVEAEFNRQAHESGKITLTIPYLIFDCHPDNKCRAERQSRQRGSDQA